MKKQRSNNKFLKIAAVSLALLALPPLAVYGQTVRCRAAQPRPALPGVMSDEIRLDPWPGRSTVTACRAASIGRTAIGPTMSLPYCAAS
uniref:hypothetical protein n=1 Tax=Gemmiger formicilis TaxID=745368 RepID=UPI00402829B8